jgi:uncharacterized membrane protein HdeD (DUF308 family)
VYATLWLRGYLESQFEKGRTVMSNEPPIIQATHPLLEELQHLRKSWGLFLGLGFAEIVLGIAAISSGIVAAFITITAAVVFGALILVAGVVHVVNAFAARGWRGFLPHLFAGILYVVVGVLMISHPLRAAAGLTLMLAAAFLIGGLVRIIVAVTERFSGWGWVLANGLIGLLLGLSIWKQWPEDSEWILGVFVGIDLILAGWTWIMLAFAARRLPAAPA